MSGRKKKDQGKGSGLRREQYSHLLDEMVGCGDMVLLEPLTEESLVENLKKRYDSGEIYVSGEREEREGGREGGGIECRYCDVQSCY